MKTEKGIAKLITILAVLRNLPSEAKKSRNYSDDVLTTLFALGMCLLFPITFAASILIKPVRERVTNFLEYVLEF